jgi:peptide/nickel transport system permease protein
VNWPARLVGTAALAIGLVAAAMLLPALVHSTAPVGVRDLARIDATLPSRYLAYVGNLLAGRVATTLGLLALGLALGGVFGAALGLVATAAGEAVPARITAVAASVAASFPVFWLVLVGAALFAHRVSFSNPIVAASVLAVSFGFAFANEFRARLTRGLHGEWLSWPVSRIGRAESVVRYFLRHSAVTAIVCLRAYIAPLLGACVVVETLLAINGVGRLLMTSIAASDTAAATGVMATLGILTLVIVLVLDILARFVRPFAEW